MAVLIRNAREADRSERMVVVEVLLLRETNCQAANESGAGVEIVSTDSRTKPQVAAQSPRQSAMVVRMVSSSSGAISSSSVSEAGVAGVARGCA